MNNKIKKYIGRGLGAPRAQEQGYITITSWCRCVHPPESSLNPQLMGFLWSFLIQAQPIINCISSLSLLSRELGVKLKIPSFYSQLGLPGDQPSSSSHPGAHPKLPHQNKRCSSHPRNYKGFRSPVSGTGIKDQISEYAPSVLVAKEITRVSGALCQGWGEGQEEGPSMYSLLYITISHCVLCFLVFTHLFCRRNSSLGKQRTGRWVFSHTLEAGQV